MDEAAALLNKQPVSALQLRGAAAKWFFMTLSSASGLRAGSAAATAARNTALTRDHLAA
jgi:hypothetical protein